MDLERRTDEVHRQILQLLPPDLFDFSDLHAGIARVEAMLGAAQVTLPDTVAVDDHHVVTGDGHDLVVRVYRPAAADPSAPALYWMHGGGLVLGDVSIDDAHCADIADRTGLVVASVDYRVAPAWPFPTPVDDCETGLDWLVAHADSLGIDADRIAVGGGSAGGCLAAGVAIRLRDRGGWQPRFLLLRYPMLDDRNETPSSHAVNDARVWDRSANIAGWTAYLGDRIGTADVPPDAAPARTTEFAGLPATMITVGALDLLLDEDIDFARGLLAAGVPTQLHVYPSSFHGSDVMVAHAPVSQRWRSDELAALTAALGPPA